MENVDMRMILDVGKIKLNDVVRYELYDVEARYDAYIKELINLEPEKLKRVLQYIKVTELEKTQVMESVPKSTAQINIENAKTTSIDEISKIIIKKENLTLEEIDFLHSFLIEGTRDDIEKNHGFRKMDVRVSGMEFDEYIENGKIVRKARETDDIYIPPKSSEITIYMQMILDYLNNDDDKLETDTALIKPFIVHALIAILQPFGNGNSRLSRLIQHGKLLWMTNHLYEDIFFEKPILCLSENYEYSRYEYRANIANIAKSKSQEELNAAWNKWFLYNLYMAGEQLNVMEKSLEKIKKVKLL